MPSLRLRPAAGLPLQAGGAIDKFVWNFESFGQMRGQRFYTEDFRGVLSTEPKIHAELFICDSRPIRSIASAIRVDVHLHGPVAFRVPATGYPPNGSSFVPVPTETI